MENKYYTPEIEEFHDGFEYEFKYKNRQWEKTEHSFGTSMDGHAGDWFEFSPECSNTQVRVKHLDREDIESLGFNMNPMDTRVFYKRLDSGKELYINIGWSSPITDEVSTVITNIIRDDGMRVRHEHFLFNGIIKNKSELKRILKQIGV